jgi:type I restriction enzyme R subunit
MRKETKMDVVHLNQKQLAARWSISWTLRGDAALQGAGIEAMEIAREAEALLSRFPNAAVNLDEQRRFRAALYKPLLALSQDERARVVDLVVKLLLMEGE